MIHRPFPSPPAIEYVPPHLWTLVPTTSSLFSKTLTSTIRELRKELDLWKASDNGTLSLMFEWPTGSWPDHSVGRQPFHAIRFRANAARGLIDVTSNRYPSWYENLRDVFRRLKTARAEGTFLNCISDPYMRLAELCHCPYSFAREHPRQVALRILRDAGHHEGRAGATIVGEISKLLADARSYDEEQRRQEHRLFMRKSRRSKPWNDSVKQDVRRTFFYQSSAAAAAALGEKTRRSHAKQERPEKKQEKPEQVTEEPVTNYNPQTEFKEWCDVNVDWIAEQLMTRASQIPDQERRRRLLIKINTILATLLAPNLENLTLKDRYRLEFQLETLNERVIEEAPR